MAIIHRTTMSPGKLELLAAWLPAQPWYHGPGGRLWAPWRLPDGTTARGVLASAQYQQHPAGPA